MDTDEFEGLVPDAVGFLEALKADNSRDWLQAHKADYERAIKTPATLLLDAIADDLRRLTGATPNTKLFRINRDVRFSKDKTRYNTHMPLLWAQPSAGQSCNRFPGISPEYVTVGCGIMALENEALTRYRIYIDGSGGSRIAREIEMLVAAGARMDPPELKRVPAPFDKDHDNGPLLRRKSLVLWYDIGPEVARAGIRKAAAATFRSVDGLRVLLDQAVGFPA